MKIKPLNYLVLLGLGEELSAMSAKLSPKRIHPPVSELIIWSVPPYNQPLLSAQESPMSGKLQIARPPRSDALRNRANILGVAIKHFQDYGTGASLEGIAKEAGIGVGTLYRHFPQREDLIAAVLQTREVALGQTIERLNAMADAKQSLQSWIEALNEYLTSFDGLADPLSRAMMAAESSLAISCDWLVGVTERFLTAAQLAGFARKDLKARDLFLLVLASSWVTRSVVADKQSLRSVRTVIWDGIQAASAGLSRQ